MIKEKLIKNSVDSVSIPGTSMILYQMIKCVCKIKIESTFGTGFFCRIPIGNNITMTCLMTNYHVIDEKYFRENDKIDLLLNDYNDAKVIDLRIKRKNYFNKEYDITIIELNKNDKIKNFLELDDNLFKDETKTFFEGISIYSIQYQNGDTAVVSYGLVNSIDNYNIKHACSTTKGSSGSPILNLSNNKVFGIHKEGSIRGNFNIGTFLKYPLNDFLVKIYNKEKESTDIKSSLDFKRETINNNLNINNNEILIIDINNLINKKKENIIYESSIKENIEKNIDKIINNITKGKDMTYNNDQNTKIDEEIINGDKIEEKCVVSDKDGNRYEGRMKNGKYEGKGIMYYGDKSKYEGCWKNGKYEGEGTMYYGDNARYEGFWKNGKKDGKGIMYYSDGARYEGEWKNGQYDGEGTMYYNDGGRYEGEWKKGQYDGIGKMFYGDGARYEGGFLNGKREGKGAMFYTNGRIDRGIWKNDKKESKGFFFSFW